MLGQYSINPDIGFLKDRSCFGIGYVSVPTDNYGIGNMVRRVEDDPVRAKYVLKEQYPYGLSAASAGGGSFWDRANLNDSMLLISAVVAGILILGAVSQGMNGGRPA